MMCFTSQRGKRIVLKKKTLPQKNLLNIKKVDNTATKDSTAQGTVRK